jgi:carbamoylphosphate synthase large subunit
MTDLEMADRTSVEPIVPAVVACILAKEKPDARVEFSDSPDGQS